MKMIVGEYTFDVEYADNNTAEAFKKMLPVTLKMEELNGNEKYGYIDSSLPTASGNPGTIKNVADLKKALGSGDITIKFE